MKRVNSFNVMDDLKEMYVFHVAYCAPNHKGLYSKKCSIESSPFNFRDTCLGAMHHEIDVLQAKGAVITSCYVDMVMVPDTEKQF